MYTCMYFISYDLKKHLRIKMSNTSSSVPVGASSDSEVSLFDFDDSGSETEIEVDDNSDSREVDEVISTAASELDDSGMTVMVLSSNEDDIDSGSDTEFEDSTQSASASRESVHEIETVTNSVVERTVDQSNVQVNASRSLIRESSEITRTNQSVTGYGVNDGAGPSQVPVAIETVESFRPERIPYTITITTNQGQYLISNQVAGTSDQSQNLQINTRATINNSNSNLTTELPTSRSRNSQESESRPDSDARQPSNQEAENANYLQVQEEPMSDEVLTIEVPSNNDSLGDFKTPKKSATKTNEDCRSDDDAETCIICYEPWTNSGIHRLTSLRCGHLFGQSCIEKWLKGQGGKCPQCNSKAKKADIRVIYAKALRTVDTTDRDRAVKELEREKELRRKIELEAAKMNLKYKMALEEVNRMKAELKTQQNRAQTQTSFSFSSSQPSTSSSSNSFLQGQETNKTWTSKGQYLLDKSIMITQNGGCRVMSYDGANYSLVASMPSPNQLFPGFGVKKISALDVRSSQYVPIHSKMIRDISFNGRHDGLLLSASIDKTVKITSLTSNTVVQSYNTKVPAWCCAWNTEDVNYIYAGLQNGTVRIYDTRQTSTEVEILNKEGSRCPIVSLNYVPAAPPVTSFWSAGLLSGTLEGITFWEKLAATEYRPQKQLEGNCTCLNFDPVTRHCLASFRPNKSHPVTRHMMCELKSIRAGDDSDGTQHALVTCNVVQTMYSGTTMKLLTKSAMFGGPSGDAQILVAAGDEASGSAMVWDANTGNLAQRLSVRATVLDVCPFSFNRNEYLACLTEKQVKLFRWQARS